MCDQDLEKMKMPLTLETSSTSRSSCREADSTQDGQETPGLDTGLGSTLNEPINTLPSAYKCGWCTCFPVGLSCVFTLAYYSTLVIITSLKLGAEKSITMITYTENLEFLDLLRTKSCKESTDIC